MKGSPRLALWVIILLTISSIFINFPNPLNKNLNFRKGLDLAGGTSITLRADMKGISPDQRDKALDASRNIIERRVNLFGVSEPIIQTSKTEGDFRIIVELSGISLEQARSIVGRTAKLEFREVLQGTTSAILLYENTKPTVLNGGDLEDAQPSFDSNTGSPIVLFRVQGKSQDRFFNTTKSLLGKRMGIFLDKQFISAPVVQSAISDSGQISGQFTTEEAKQLSTVLNAGALPVALTELEHFTIGPTLGEESLRKSLFAGFLGFVTIVVFMGVLYGKRGILASLALCLYTLLVVSIFKISSVTPYGITLTLSGIAGFILSIGMAVDANILIFERMKEEERLGRSPEIAVDLGFSRAWPSIRDSNISTLITSTILYKFGTGQVRGFALVLALGVLVSMFSAIVVTRTLLRLFYK